MSYRLYLDDERNPKTEGPWVIVRTYKEFVRTIERDGLPSYISFDHDLGEESQSGHEAAKWLIEYGLDNQLPIEEIGINVHSANPVGRDNIRGIFASYQSFRMEYPLV